MSASNPMHHASPLCVYVAGASTEIELCRSFMRELEAAGVKIAVDWPAVIDGHAGKANPGGDMKDVALLDLLGVQKCNIFWLVLPPGKIATIGAWVELGWAFQRQWSTGAPVILMSGERPERTIFSSCATYYRFHREALEHILTVKETFRP